VIAFVLTLVFVAACLVSIVGAYVAARRRYIPATATPGGAEDRVADGAALARQTRLVRLLLIVATVSAAGGIFAAAASFTS